MTDEEMMDKWENDPYIHFTDNPYEAIYVMRDGTMISGDYSYSARTQDHRCAETLFNDMNRYTEGFWEKLFERTEMVMLVPENQQIMFPDWMRPTREQVAVMRELPEYELLDY